MIFLLTSDDISAIQKAHQATAAVTPNLNQDDLIEAFTGIPNLTHAWNEFGLKADVVQRVARQVSATQCESA